MAIELSFILPFGFQLSHLFQRFKHDLCDFLVSGVHTSAYLQAISPDQLIFDACSISREVPNKLRNSLTLLAGKFGLFNSFQLISLLCSLLEFLLRLNTGASLTTCLSNKNLRRECCFSSRPMTKGLPFSSTSI